MAIATTERLRNYLQNYLDAFNAFGARAQRQPEWLRGMRERAFARFCEVGFPTTKDEDWRFTNVNAIAQTSFELARDAQQSAGAYSDALKPYRIPGAACQLVFVNGRFAPALSEFGSLPEGVRVTSLAQALAEDSRALETHLGRYVNIQRDAFCALNTAFTEDGAYVYVPRRTALEAPVCLLFVSIPSEEPQITNPRNL